LVLLFWSQKKIANFSSWRRSMARQEIVLGTPPTGLGGDPPRTASTKVNSMTQELYSFLGGSGTSLALPPALPVNKGGTGTADGRPAFLEIEINSSSLSFGRQGLHLGWGGSGQAGFSGEATFVCNRGPSGSGGFTWVSVNANATAAGPAMTYSYEGLLKVPSIQTTAPIALESGGTGANTPAGARTAIGLGVSASPQFASIELSSAAPYIDWHFNNTSADYDVRLVNDVSGTLTCTGALASIGTWCRTGAGGQRGGNLYNLNWTGAAMDVYVASTYIGSITLFTSDYRIKKMIKDLKVDSFLDRIDAYRIVTFQKKVFGDVFRGDGTTYQGLIAHEAQQVNPLAVSGEKDGVDGEGNPIVQQLEPMALITDLMGAIKELRAEVAALKAAQP
jgi:hypothetical protein